MIKQTTVSLTEDDLKALIDIINAVNFQGASIEMAYELKLKIKSALETINMADNKLKK